MDNNNTELSWGVLRYSKRIIIVAMLTWVFIVTAILAFLVTASLHIIEIDDYIAQVLKTILTSSSTVTISLGLAYYGHSLFSKEIENKIKPIQINSDNETTGAG